MMTTRIQRLSRATVLCALALSGCMQTNDDGLASGEQGLTIDDVREELTPGQHRLEPACQSQPHHHRLDLLGRGCAPQVRVPKAQN
jgi:hypothetical protein